jgi:transcriptional regulator with PAS, ATPase and Fis domain
MHSISEFMEPAVTLTPEDLLSRAAFPGASRPLLVTRDGSLLGYIPPGTEGDLGARAGDVMRAPVESLDADRPIWDGLAEAVCISGRQGVVPLTSAGALAGVLSMERLLSHTSRALEYLDIILEHNEDSIWIMDGLGTVLVAGRATENMTRMKPYQLVGRNVEEMTRSGVLYPSAALRAILTGQPATILQDTVSGRRVAVTATPVTQEDGATRYVLAVTRDLKGILEEIRTIYPTEQDGEFEGMRARASRVGLFSDSREAFDLAKVAQGQQGFIFHSEEMQRVLRIASKVAAVDTTVLLLGGSGVGKGLLARMIHELSARRNEPFVEINCAAIPRELLESELFGYEPGAFTGADRRGKAGLVELAQGGTLFLDEVAELPLEMQGKLLRLLHEKQILRVGGIRPMSVNTRIIAATNRDLDFLVAQGRFREDLYYRLNVVPITIPPLRDRREDLMPLCLYYLEMFNRQHGAARTFSSASLHAMASYDWPGNVRELRNIIERLVIMGDVPEITVDELPLANKRRPARPQGEAVSVHEIVPLREMVRQAEEQLIRLALRRYGSTRRAASVLGISQSTIVKKRKAWRDQGHQG